MRKRRNCKREDVSLEEEVPLYGCQACAECTNNCLSVHTTERNPYPLVYRFFKVMLGDDFSDVLFLPPRFSRSVSKFITNRQTYLEDSLGQQYKVTLSELDGSLAFQKGWHEFSVEHGVEKGDFLVFYLVRGVKKPYFVVQIFGRSGCEKLNSSQEDGIARKRSRMDANAAAPFEPCKRQAVSLVGKQSLSTSVVPKSHFRDSQIQLVTNNDVEKLSLVPSVREVEEPLDMLNRDDGQNQDDSIRLFDLSSSEKMGNSSDANETIRIVNGGEGTSSHADKHMKSQNGSGLVDTFPVLREVSSSETPQCGADIYKYENVEESGPVNDTSDMSQKDLIVGRSGLHLGTSSVASAENNKHCLNAGPIDKLENNVLNFSDSPVSTPMLENPFGEMTKNVKEELVELREKFCDPPQFLSENPPTVTLDDVQGYLAIDENNKIVKTEPDDSLDISTSSAVTDSIVVVADQPFLQLTSSLPSISFRGPRRRPIYLRAEDGRVWPVMYHERSGFKVLASGWQFFKSKYQIRPGDSCRLRLEDQHEHIYRLYLLRKK